MHPKMWLKYKFWISSQRDFILAIMSECLDQSILVTELSKVEIILLCNQNKCVKCVQIHQWKYKIADDKIVLKSCSLIKAANCGT